MLGSKVPMLQEEGPLPGSESGSCLTLRNELSEETHVLTKQMTLLGRGARAESSRVRQTGELPYYVARSLRFYGNGLVSRLSLASHLARAIV